MTDEDSTCGFLLYGSFYSTDGDLDYGMIYEAVPEWFDLADFATPYAVSQSAYAWDDPGNPYAGDSRWWLRTPGGYPYSASFVYADGFVCSVRLRGAMNLTIGVIPALWITF